ncbi:hypothetical protein [uncultured Victivallis sp.]|uniref:hypothetical protein n=1 Tax=uncultured Victivallis sp. TaxID=354118 RepID=UPI0025EBCC0B|nr:hypothetical protein [uncultured Victivallis sp.]
MGIAWEIVNMNKILLLIAFVAGIVINLFGNDTQEMLFTSPLIYKPVIEMALKNIKEPLSPRRVIKLQPMKITMEMSDFVPGQETSEEFDEFRQISFKEIDNIKILIFKKDNFVHQLHVLRTEGGHTSVTKYKRNLTGLFANLNTMENNEKYLQKTREIIISLLKQEDFLTDFSSGEHVLTFHLELATGVAMGNVSFSDYPDNHLFCYYNFSLENSALLNKQTQVLVFAITFWNKYISLANLFDDKMMNGFECYFYPNQGLRFLTELKNGKQMDVTSWDKNGDNERKIPFNEWTKIISNTKLMKESQ